jgi:hypothetical protein
MKFFKVILLLFIGLFIGIFSALSFFRTEWENFHPDFFFWWSIVATIISLFLLCFSIWQHLSVESEVRKGDAQVKIWMQDANGLRAGLQTIVVNCIVPPNQQATSKYSSVNDVGMAVYAFSSAAQALYQSLYEERCITEEEYRQQQKKFSDAMQAQQLKKINEPEGSS